MKSAQVAENITVEIFCQVKSAQVAENVTVEILCLVKSAQVAEKVTAHNRLALSLLLEKDQTNARRTRAYLVNIQT